MAVCSAPVACACKRVRRAPGRLVRRGQSPTPVLTALAISTVLFLGKCAWGKNPNATFSVEPCSYRAVAAQVDLAHTTTNFRVRSFDGGPHATDVARHCEQVCQRLRSAVFGLEPSARWQPQCMIVLHASRASYSAAVGSGASQTIGSSTISLSGGRVTKRRVDLLAVDPAKGLAALPHELVHVLFVDAFPDTPPPKWSEEGLALTFDPADKRARHERDLRSALDSRSTLPLARLLADPEYPSPTHRAAFYAQSLSLAEYLLQQAPATEFIRFVKLSTDRGATHALNDVYHFAPAELERGWRMHLASSDLAALP